MVQRIVRRLILLTSLLFIGLYLAVALVRLSYPFELEWMEGGMVAHVGRILDGQPIYAKPSLGFVSFFFPPFYYIVAAAAARVMGLGFVPLRLVSLVSSIGIFVLLFEIVRRETGAARTGALAAGLFAATYGRSGGWFDVARGDSLYLLLLLAAAFVLRRTRAPAGAVAAGVLLTAAYLTKQSAILVAFPLAVGCALTNRAGAGWFLAATAAGATLSTVLLNRATDNWFTYYCFTLPWRHPAIAGAWPLFWRTDMIKPLGLVCVASCWYVYRSVRRERSTWFFPLLGLGLIALSWAIRTRLGADGNDLMPAYAAASMLAAFGLHDIERPGGRLASAAQVLTLAQFALLSYNPSRFIPTRADRAAAEYWVERIAAIKGDVFAPHHGYLAARAGKPVFAHTLAVDQVLHNDAGPEREALMHDIEAALRDREFAAVVVEVDRWREDRILPTYPVCERLFARQDVFIPVTGAPLRPEFICLPSSAAR